MKTEDIANVVTAGPGSRKAQIDKINYEKRDVKTGDAHGKLENPDEVTQPVPNEFKDVMGGTKDDPDKKPGLRADQKKPGPSLPRAYNEYSNQRKAEEDLKSERSKRDQMVKDYGYNKKTSKRDIREKSILPDDFDLGDDEFSSTDPFVHSLFQKVKINSLLKDQIKESYPDEIAAITERIKNDPENKDLTGKEKRKLINAAVKEFIEPIWKGEGGDVKVQSNSMITSVASALKKIVAGKSDASVQKVFEDKRKALESKQNKSMEDILFLKAWDLLEANATAEGNIAEQKQNVKAARSKLTAANAAVKQHEAAVDRALSEYNKGTRKSKTEHKDGWYITKVSGGGANASYAARVEDRDGKKQFVGYSVTAGSPDTFRDPVYIKDYQEYNGERDPNVQDFENFAEANLNKVEGGTKGQAKERNNTILQQDFARFDGKNYFDLAKQNRLSAPKYYKIIHDLGGKIASNGKIYTTSVADYPEGTPEYKLDYKEAVKLQGSKGSTPEEVKANQLKTITGLTGMSEEEARARVDLGLMKDFKLGDANVFEQDGKLVYRLPEENKTSVSGAKGRSFYINWNEPHNRQVVKKYAEMGIDKKDIPLSELKTVNTSRSNEGNVDWTDTKKTAEAEKIARQKYEGTYKKPEPHILDTLIGFRR